jgi:hypothetical protein
VSVYNDDEEAARERLAVLEEELARVEAEEPPDAVRALEQRLGALEERVVQACAHLPDAAAENARVWRQMVVAVWLFVLGLATLMVLAVRRL